MRDQMPEYIILQDPCPECGEQVIALWEMRSGRYVWQVQCDACSYEYPQPFNSLEDLAKKFEAKD